MGAHDFSRPSYSEMQKMNFDNILQALEQDSSRMRGSRQEVKEEFKTVERIIYKEDVNENYDNWRDNKFILKNLHKNNCFFNT